MPDIDIDFSVRGRERMIRYVADKYGRESVAQIITFGKMAPRAATRDAARVLGYDYGTGDRLAKLIPEPIMGRSPSFAECLKSGRRPQIDLRRRARREEDHRRRPGPRGDHPQQLDPRRRGGDLRPTAARGGAAAAGRGQDRAAAGQRRRQNGQTGAPVQDRDPVLDGPGRGPGPAEDGLPRPAQPRRDRGRDRHHPALARRGDRDRLDPARRREDLRDARPRRLDRRLPVRVRRDARRAETGRPDRVPRPGRARRPLPPGRDGLHPRLREGEERPLDGPLPGPAPAPDHRGDARLRDLPGAVDGHLALDGGLLRYRGGRSAQGDRQEEARPDGDHERQIHGRAGEVQHRPERRRRPLETERSGRRLLLQQVARRLLRADLLPHRLPQGQLPGRVHGGGDLLGDEHQRQGALLRQPLRGNGHRRAAAGRQRLRPQLRRRRQRDPLRPRRGEERRPRGGRGDPAHPRRRPDRPRSTTSANGSTRARSTNGRSNA